MSIQRKPSKLEQKLILSPIRTYIKSKYNITVEQNDTTGLKGPYIILSNHVNNWDPLFINCFVDEPLCFVAAAPLFRNKALKKLLDYTGAISKTKSRTDTSTIRSMLLAKKHNRSIAIFPEGNRNWNGHSEPIVYATAKLVKLLDIPVIIAKIKGGYLSHPRWAENKRKGKVSITFEKKWDAGAFTNKSVEEVYFALSEALQFDEIAWNKEHQYRFKGKDLAQYLERHIFACPNCEAIGNMYSEGDIFKCNACRYTVRYNEFGWFEQYSEKLHFQYIKDWNDWQLQFIAHKKSNINWQIELETNIFDEVHLLISENNKPFGKKRTAQLNWKDQALALSMKDTLDELIIPLKQIESVNVNMHNKLDFFYENQMYRLSFFHPRSSAYMWQKLIELYQQPSAEE